MLLGVCMSMQHKLMQHIAAYYLDRRMELPQAFSMPMKTSGRGDD